MAEELPESQHGSLLHNLSARFRREEILGMVQFQVKYTLYGGV